MRGELVDVWQYTWDELWVQLTDQDDIPADIFCELYRELSLAFRNPPTLGVLADIIDDSNQSKEAFQSAQAADFESERKLAEFFERSFDVFDDLGGDELSNKYFLSLEDFLRKYSLRYELRRPFSLCPSLTGLFSSLILDIQAISQRDPHLDSLLKEFEHAFRDLRGDQSEGKIKTCIQKQINLLEAISRRCPGVSRNTLGAICDELATWPHEKIRESIKAIYKFTNEYPGIRHGGDPNSVLRPIEMKDLIGVSLLLAGFAPYLCHELSADSIYRRGG